MNEHSSNMKIDKMQGCGDQTKVATVKKMWSTLEPLRALHGLEFGPLESVRNTITL